MRITVCELPDETARRDAAWAELVGHLRAHPTDVVVLPFLRPPRVFGAH